MQNIIEEQIIRIETVPLTKIDLQTLIKRKNDFSFLAISTYIIISSICLYVWLSKPSSNNVDNKSFRVFFTNSDKEVLTLETTPFSAFFLSLNKGTLKLNIIKEI